LCRVGIDEIELGVASPVHGYLPKLVADARRLTKGACRLALWCRCLEEDITFAATCRPDVLALSIPVSDAHIRERLGKDRRQVRQGLGQAVRQALGLGIAYVSVGLEDASRADLSFVLDMAGVAQQHGASRVRLADTVGICSPGTIRELVVAVQGAVHIEVGVHCHNDFGMATANSIAALEAGANCLDATVLGLGERAGNCRLEEAVGFLALARGHEQYRTEFLPALCREVAEATGRAIAANHPLIGPEIFTCESGLHQHGLFVNPSIYEPYAPERVGSARTLRFGGKTGRRAVSMLLEQQGLQLDEGQLGGLLRRIRSVGQALTEQQVLCAAHEGLQRE